MTYKLIFYLNFYVNFIYYNYKMKKIFIFYQKFLVKQKQMKKISFENTIFIFFLIMI